MGEESTFLWCDKAPALSLPAAPHFLQKLYLASGLRS